jgi:hypothetical protein
VILQRKKRKGEKMVKLYRVIVKGKLKGYFKSKRKAKKYAKGLQPKIKIQKRKYK